MLDPLDNNSQVDALYYVTPKAAATPGARPDTAIGVWRARPAIDSRAAQATLEAVLEHAHTTLGRRVPVTCHGFLPDPDTINPSASLPQRCIRCGDVLAFCPKPHIGAHIIDRVCPRCDCLRSRRLCHIIGRGAYTSPPFVRRILTRDDLIAGVKTLRTWLNHAVQESDESDEADHARTQLMQTIGELTESYVKLTRADTLQTEHILREWVFGDHWSDATQPRGLPLQARNMLISGEYVWMQFQTSTIEDWAACAVQYTRALEYELHRRLYEPCGGRLLTKDGLSLGPKQFTIGTPMFVYRERKNDSNWRTMLEHVAAPSGVDETTLRQVVIDIEAVRVYRNKVAHTEHVNAALARTIRDAILGRQGQPGLLYRIITMLNALTTPSS